MLNLINVYSGTELIIAGASFLVAILFALTIHEYSHALIAYKQGDLTAKTYGRLTINPYAHIDILGFLSLLLFGFGWAKPVPINPLKFKNYRKGLFLTSIAGIVANFLSFILFSLLYVLYVGEIIPNFANADISLFISTLLLYLTNISLVLAIFNLLPIRPLDGFNMICAISKRENSFIRFMNRYSLFVLIALIISGMLEKIIYYLYNLISSPIINLWITLFT